MSMAFPTVLAAVQPAWGLSNQAAGSISAASQAGTALSLVVLSAMADYLGPRAVFLVSSAIAAVVALVLPVLAQGHASALVLFFVMAVVVAGSYTPGVMLIASRFPPARRGSARPDRAFPAMGRLTGHGTFVTPLVHTNRTLRVEADMLRLGTLKLVVLVLALLVAGPDPARADPEVVFGGAISLTGRFAEPAGRQVNSIRMWVDEVNGRGGILGRKIKLEFSRVTRDQFEAKRAEYHRELQEAFFTEFRIKDTTMHVIRSGESIWVIAQQRYNIPIWLLRQYNPDLDLGSIRPGTKLVIPIVESTSGTAEPNA